MRIENNFKGHLIEKPPKVNNANISLEAKFLYLSYLGLVVTSSVLVGLNACLARPNLLNEGSNGLLWTF